MVVKTPSTFSPGPRSLQHIPLSKLRESEYPNCSLDEDIDEEEAVSSPSPGYGKPKMPLTSTTPPPDRLDKRKSTAVFVLVSLSQFLVYMLFSTLPPFFPDYLREQFGAQGTIIGIFFSIFPLCNGLFSPVASELCRRMGSLRVWYLGLFMLLVSMIVFAVADNIGACMGASALQGAASTLVVVSTYAILIPFSSNLMGMVAFLDGAVMGVGLMVGPLAGTMLYSSLGVHTMFWVLGSLPVALTIIQLITMRIYNISASAPSSSEEGVVPQKIPIWVLLQTPTGGAAALALAVTAAAAGFIEPLLARQLQLLLGLPVSGVGLVWALYNLIYTGGGILLGYMGDRMQPRGIMSIGLFMMGVSFILMGPVPFLNSIPFTPTMAWVLEVGCLSGIAIGCALAMVPAMPLMLKVISKGDGREEEVSDSVAAMYVAFWSIGEYMGPTIGGVMDENMKPTRAIICKPPPDLDTCETAFPWASACFGFLLLISWVLFQILTRDRSAKGEERDDLGSPNSGLSLSDDIADKIQAVVVAQDNDRSPRKRVSPRKISVALAV